MSVKRERYSVNIQMILSIIPVVDLWAAYRIEKLRFWILLWIGLVWVDLILMDLILIDSSLIELALSDSTIGSIAGYEIYLVVHFLIVIPIAVFLMKHFTMEWNKKIDAETKSQNDSSFQDKTPQDSES